MFLAAGDLILRFFNNILEQIVMETRDQVYGGASGFPSDLTFTCHHAVLFDDLKVHTFHLFDLLLHRSASPRLHRKCQGDLAETFRVGRTWSRIVLKDSGLRVLF